MVYLNVRLTYITLFPQWCKITKKYLRREGCYLNLNLFSWFKSNFQLGFYELMIISLFVILVGTFIYTIISKLIYDRQSVWYDREKLRLGAELQELVPLITTDEFPEEVKLFIKKNKRVKLKRRFYELMEEILFDMIENNENCAYGARIIASELKFPPESVKNLKKGRKSTILRGCMQARAYLYKPAIPYLINQLYDTSVNMQYDILMALSYFNDPEIIVQAFEIIQKSVLVNQRTVCQIIKRTRPENREVLFEGILELSSEDLSSQFLKCIDRDAAVKVIDKIIPLFSEDHIKELRIAAIKAIAATNDKTLIPELIKALQDSQWELRAVAANGLEMMPDESALQALMTAVCDSEWWVRQNAAMALLAYPSPENNMIEVLKTKDFDAIENLTNAAEQKNMSTILYNLQEKLQYH